MHTLKDFFHRHESLLGSLTLVLGFIFDYITLDRVDFFWDNFFIVLYLLLSGACIILFNLHKEGKIWKPLESMHEFLPFILQFAFGGLFSAFVVFYSKSASMLSSWPFLLVLLVLLVGNEFFKKRYSKLVFQIGIYFSALFSFSIYMLPVATRQFGPAVFISSGLTSLVLVGIFIFIIYKLAPRFYREDSKYLLITIFSLYAVINLFYFTNVIPPIPLSLKSADVYYRVERAGSGYLAAGEKDSWGEKFGLPQTIHIAPGEPAYVFSSVFAPARLGTTVVHNWKLFDEEEGEWVSLSRISFKIEGGRSEGYRGFSKKETIYPGKWRVDIETDRGQVIGRVRFDIELGDPIRGVETEIL